MKRAVGRWASRGLAGCAALLCAVAAWAHKPSDSYLSIEVKPGAVTGQWDIALRDLDVALGLDADGNGEITWGEVRARHDDIAAYASARLRLTADEQPCALTVAEQLVDDHTDGAYSVLPLTWACEAASPGAVAVDYRLFAELDPQHRGLLKLAARGATRTAVLVPNIGPGAAAQRFELGATDPWRAFVDYLREGVWHIWIGLDHILFLLSLLLPSVLIWQAAARRWEPVARFGEAFWGVVKVVTAFTVAHSITLTLAVLGVIELPSRLVESVIAASVVAAALNNVWPRVLGRLWMVAFGFGLVHGFGFASVLADLGLPSDALALALLGFNVGVELGQLAIVVLFLPLAFALRRTGLYRRTVMVGGSLAIATLACIWLVERAAGVTLLGL
jgi:HupE / UreJ protein